MTFDLRPDADADHEFLWRVASTTMSGYVEAIMGWDEAWQERRFRGNFGACSWRVIVVEGQDAGGLQAGPRPTDGDLCLANVYLLPPFQGRGVGSAVVRSLMADARAEGVPLTLNVLRSNPDARRLYERLGLRVVGENEERFFLSTSAEGAIDLEFLPVDLDRCAPLCITFAVDTDACSFGSAEQFHGEDGTGAERYIQRLRAKLAADTESCLHVWRGGTVVGQLNLGQFIDPSVGYVSVFYVTPAWRGKGVADAMEQYATDWFKRRGFASARLSVTPSNVRAVRFYLRSGWRDLGPREDKPELHNMEKTFE